MGSMNLKDVRKHLSDLVRAAERGQSTVITRRGKPVARIGPAGEEHRSELPDLGELRRSIRLKGEPMSRTVIAMRREERS